MAKHSPRIYLHPDGHTLSIGFSDTQDTLLSLNGGPEAYGDAARLAEWAEAVKRALDALELAQARERVDDLQRQVDVMKEAAARIRPRLRRLEYGADADAHERDTARREIGEIADHIRQGCPIPAETENPHARNFREAMEHIETLPPSERAAVSNRSLEKTHQRACGRLLVGMGDDTYDPECVLPAGHAGACSPTKTHGQV